MLEFILNFFGLENTNFGSDSCHVTNHFCLLPSGVMTCKVVHWRYVATPYGRSRCEVHRPMVLCRK